LGAITILHRARVAPLRTEARRHCQRVANRMIGWASCVRFNVPVLGRSKNSYAMPAPADGNELRFLLISKGSNGPNHLTGVLKRRALPGIASKRSEIEPRDGVATSTKPPINRWRDRLDRARVRPHCGTIDPSGRSRGHTRALRCDRARVQLRQHHRSASAPRRGRAFKIYYVVAWRGEEANFL
jgi:hypothetical protein